jgi:hypothetical protein
MTFARMSLTMTITITAFERSPDGGRGLARDTRVRWAKSSSEFFDQFMGSEPRL